MTEIIDAIAEHIKNWTIDYLNDSPGDDIKNWGFVELVQRESKGAKTSTQPIPMTINGTADREQVALDDRYRLIEWIRWDQPITTSLSEEDSWGLKIGKRQNLPLRVVIAHKVELGENLIVDLVNELPESIAINGFDFVFLTENSTIDPDHETIYRTELGQTVYEAHRFPWNLYVINLNVEFIPCRDYTPPDYITDASGNCLFA